jgi:hypothetical protein
VAYAEQPPRPRTTLPLAIALSGFAFLAATVVIGGKAPVAGAVVFLLAMVAAIADSAKPIFTWPNAIAVLVLVIWFIPIKLYTLPVELPFNLEPYRLLLLVLVFAWIVQMVISDGRLDLLGRAVPVGLLMIVAVASTVVNFDSLRATTAESPVNPVFYFISFLLVFVLVASVINRVPHVDQVLKVLVFGGTVVALFAIYEARSRYNFFNHLAEIAPILEKQEREVLELRGGRLRVHASAQHPIAMGVALTLIVPMAIYLAKHAATAARARLWGISAGVCATAIVTTVSRTTVLMAVAMAIVAISLRGAAIARYWPALLILPVAIHFVAPGALGGLYKSFFPKEGLISSAEGRAGEAGSGRVSDLGPGLRVWVEKPVVGYGPGSTITFQREEEHLGPAPIVPVIFDNQYMSTLLQLGLLGLIGVVMLVWGTTIRLIRAARGATGPPSDLLTACAVACAGFGVGIFFFDAFAFAQCTIVFMIIAALGLRVSWRARRPILVESRTTTA